MEPVLCGRDDAGLVLTPEGVRRRALGGRLLLGGVPGRPRTRGTRRARDAGQRDAAAEQPTTAQPRARGCGAAVQESTVAVSRESGSDRALTATARSLTCSGVSWS